MNNMKKLIHGKENLQGFKLRAKGNPAVESCYTSSDFRLGHRTTCYGDVYSLSSSRAFRCRKHNMMLFLNCAYRDFDEFVPDSINYGGKP